MPHIAANQINLYYEITGAGRPLIFIHGLGSSTRDWEPQAAYFSNTHQVITFDLRGHGQSDKPAGPYHMAMFARDMAELMEGLPVDRADVVGISLGGAVGLQFALDCPGKVRTLTIVNSGPALGGTPQQAEAEIARRVGIVQQMGMRAMGEALSPALFPSPEHAVLRKQFNERWAENDPPAYIAATQSMLGWDVTARLGEITCPVLVISADHDYSPVAAKEAYVGSMPRARLVVIPDAHHATPIERPEAFNQVLAQFLAENAEAA